VAVSGTASGLVHLRQAGCSLVVDCRDAGMPVVVHWGADLGKVSTEELAALSDALVPPIPPSSFDVPLRTHLVQQRSAGHAGRPALSGHRGGHDWSPAFVPVRAELRQPAVLLLESADEAAGLVLRTELDLTPSGLLRARHTVRNDGADGYEVASLLVALPLPPQATELLDFSGRWSRERHPQRRPLGFGAWSREGRHGRTGHDATVGLLAGTGGFGFASGEVWAAHVAWSGDHVTYAESSPSGRALLGGGELLEPGEVVLAAGEEYATPWLCAAYSGAGIDGISDAFHSWLRARPQHPGPDRPRPVVLNTWEAVYFDHKLDRLRGLANVAAGIGVERFVLDDGWFRRRRDDSAGLGDWYVDETVWPQGLHPLISHVRSLGMEFGLWVEPEMVNRNSDIYRAHPDWLLSAGGRIPLEWRKQQVIDLVNPDAFDYVLSRLDALLTEYDIGYLKWDQNRDYVDAGHAGRPAVRAQTLAVYRLLDELRARHPAVEIEDCSSGGARVDLEILQRTDRVWTSDCNDALERQTIQRWTGVFIPPELLGAHVGPATSHQTGRSLDLSFRAVTALFGHAGIEWDISPLSPEQLVGLRTWIDFYKASRGLLHTGRVVRGDHPDPAAYVHGVVAHDGSEALFAYVQLATSAATTPGPVRLPGLHPDRRYAVAPVDLAGGPTSMRYVTRNPGWLADGGVTLSGRALGTSGLQMPLLNPEQALVLQVRADD
jgi:alpha-galactosidase